jgi:4-alpha-glucanotransferase
MTTIRLWGGLKNADEQRKEVWKYLKRPAGQRYEVAREMIRLAWSSVAALAMVPLQDLLGLGREARMNVPGSAEGNWRWRFTENMLSAEEFQWLEDLTKTSYRSGLSTTTSRPCKASGIIT